jgi:hypothetical protein
MILLLCGDPLVKELSLLHVCVNVVCPVLHEVVELVAVLRDIVVPLSLVEEIYHLAAHSARQ